MERVWRTGGPARAEREGPAERFSRQSIADRDRSKTRARRYVVRGLQAMQIIRHIDGQDQNLAGSVVTLGNFDGIHLGHRALIGGAVTDSKTFGVPSVVLTFEPHPLKVLAPERALKLILAHKDNM